MARGGSLSFGTKACKCGSARFVAQPCERCGTRPPQTEVDPDLDRRRKIVDAARAVDPLVVDLLAVDFDPAVLDRVFDYLRSVDADIRNFAGFASAAIAGRPGSNAEPFLAAAGRLSGVLLTLHRATEYRPMRALRVELTGTGESVSEYLDSLLDALVAPTPVIAQALVKKADLALDQADVALVNALEKFGDWGGDKPTSSYWAGILQTPIALSERTGANSIGEYGGEQLRRVFPEVSDHDDTQVLAGLAWAQIQTYMDTACFELAARRTFELVISDPRRMVQLAGTDEWLASWARTIGATFETGHAFLESTRQAPSDHYEIRQTMNLAKEVQESILKPLIATVSAVVLGRDYRHQLAQGVFSLLEWAGSRGINTDRVLAVPTRQAGAHDDWRVEVDGIWLREIDPGASGQPVLVTRLQLLDHVIELQELALALVVGLRAGMAHLGIEVPMNDTPDILVDGYSAALLSSRGWTNIELVRNDSIVALKANVPAGCALAPLFHIGDLFAESYLVAQLDDGASTSTVRIDLQALHDLQTAECGQIRVAYETDLFAKSTIDGVPMASLAAVRHRLAQVAMWAARVDEHELAVTAFRKAREVADEVKNPELKQLMKDAQGWRRTRALGLQREDKGLETLTAWHELDAPVRETL